MWTIENLVFNLPCANKSNVDKGTVTRKYLKILSEFFLPTLRGVPFYNLYYRMLVSANRLSNVNLFESSSFNGNLINLTAVTCSFYHVETHPPVLSW